MIGITSYSKVVMRLATFAGFIIGGLSFAAGIVYLILKLMYWDRFSAGMLLWSSVCSFWELFSCSLSDFLENMY